VPLMPSHLEQVEARLGVWLGQQVLAAQGPTSQGGVGQQAHVVAPGADTWGVKGGHSVGALSLAGCCIMGICRV
jgi:hypothetical protein